MIDGNLLNFVVLWFKSSSLVWAPQISLIMQPMLITLMEIAWVLMLIPIVFGGGSNLLPALFLFFIGNGLALGAMDLGPTWVDGLFSGVAQVAYGLGAPAFSPSAILSMGPQVADPIMKAIAAQGFLSYFTSFLTVSMLFASLCIIFAYAALALQLLLVLILSFLLTASCPFFVAFAGLSFTRGITTGYMRMVFGTMCGLFIIALMSQIVAELGAQMEQWLRTTLLIPGVTLTWVDLIGPMLVGGVLLCSFIWIPQKIVREMDGIMIGQVGRIAAGYAASTFVSVRNTAQSTWENRHGGSEKVNKESGVGGSGGGGNGGRHRGGNPYNQRPAPQQISAGQSNGGQQQTGARQNAWGWNR